MRRIILTFVISVISFISFAQKVSVQIDDFTDEKIIDTSWEVIYSGGMTGKNQTRLQIQSVDGSDFLKFRIYTNKVTSIDKDAEVMLKTKEGVIKAFVTGYTLSEHGAWSEKHINNNMGIYFTASVDLKKIKGLIQKIRIPLSDGNLDIDISEKDAKKIQKMISLVEEAQN